MRVAQHKTHAKPLLAQQHTKPHTLTWIFATCTIALSPTLELAPIVTECTSPRTLAPYHTDEPGPIVTSPSTVAVGATKAAAEVGAAPRNAIFLVDLTSFSVIGTACRVSRTGREGQDTMPMPFVHGVLGVGLRRKPTLTSIAAPAASSALPACLSTGPATPNTCCSAVDGGGGGGNTERVRRGGVRGAGEVVVC